MAQARDEATLAHGLVAQSKKAQEEAIGVKVVEMAEREATVDATEGVESVAKAVNDLIGGHSRGFGGRSGLRGVGLRRARLPAVQGRPYL
jgi:hypothetical protein